MSKAIEIQDFHIWNKMKNRGALVSFDLEITARCNNNCKHCYINLPAGDLQVKSLEMTPKEICRIADQAVSLGAVWCLITGGEPLLRPDFEEIYLMLKFKGLLTSVFTNATLINENHIKLFKNYPPRDIEVTVYGATKDTYEKVTRQPGSYKKFIDGLNLLIQNNVKFRLKAMALRDNLHELDLISKFCRKHTADFYRFDPVLHLRFDRNADRNEEIREERLTPEEVVTLEKKDIERYSALQLNCDNLINSAFAKNIGNYLFRCGSGINSFNVSFDGKYRLCSSLWAPGTTFDLRQGTLEDARSNLMPKVRDLRSNKKEYLESCNNCEITNLCLWCPAHAYLETGEMDGATPYFCAVAHARAAMLEEK